MLIAASMQEKIAKSLQHHEQNLAWSQYGKYFARNMNLLLLKRDPDAWKARQASKKEAPSPSANDQAKRVHRSAPERPFDQLHAGVPLKPSSKRKRKEGDDIGKLL